MRWIKPEWSKGRRRKRNHGPGGYPNLFESLEGFGLGAVQVSFVYLWEEF